MSTVLFPIACVWLIAVAAYYLHVLITLREQVKQLTARVSDLEGTLTEIVKSVGDLEDTDTVEKDSLT